VILIIEGRTRICVDENGWERVLAERGPGQLVGERGGLNVRVCPATVIAIEPVWALVVPTEDFTAFVRAYPRVLDIVESQLCQWLIEDQTPYRDVTVKGRRPPPLSGENCTILLTDVVAFGSPSRNDEDRRVIREALFGMTNMTLRNMTDVRSEDRGDGLLTVVPPSIPTANVIERLVTELPRSLERHNSTNRESAHIRLRVAVDVGPVTTDTMGVSGQAIIVAARLVEAPSFKEAIVRSPANLGLIVSPFVYDTAVRHTLNPIDLAGYSPIQVRVKGFSSSAWVKLFDAPTSASYFFQPVTTARLGALSTSYLWRRQGAATARAGALAGPGFPAG
jgi:class 3 adenylate cyclase